MIIHWPDLESRIIFRNTIIVSNITNNDYLFSSTLFSQIKNQHNYGFFFSLHIQAIFICVSKPCVMSSFQWKLPKSHLLEFSDELLSDMIEKTCVI